MLSIHKRRAAQDIILKDFFPSLEPWVHVGPTVRVQSFSQCMGSYIFNVCQDANISVRG